MKKICVEQMLTKTTLEMIIYYYVLNRQNIDYKKANISIEIRNNINNRDKNL